MVTSLFLIRFLWPMEIGIMSNIFAYNRENINKAGEVLRNGGLVAFSTETVYGLGADATNDKAVASIFAAKGRPTFNPLIVHVNSLADAKAYVHITDTARKLAEQFSPGPLTMVLLRKENSGLSPLVSAGLDSVAIRIPNHQVANDLIKASNRPIAAPSANASGTVSPTIAEHVYQSLGDKVNMIIDGGACKVGVESTVLDLTGEKVALLRYGGTTKEEIEKILGYQMITTDNNDTAPRSPGQLSSHYAPTKKLYMNVPTPKDGQIFIGFGNVGKCDLNLSETGDLVEATANLFAMMRDADKLEGDSIAVAPIPMYGLGLAINDRLRRASYPK